MGDYAPTPLFSQALPDLPICPHCKQPIKAIIDLKKPDEGIPLAAPVEPLATALVPHGGSTCIMRKR